MTRGASEVSKFSSPLVVRASLCKEVNDIRYSVYTEEFPGCSFKKIMIFDLVWTATDRLFSHVSSRSPANVTLPVIHTILVEDAEENAGPRDTADMEDGDV